MGHEDTRSILEALKADRATARERQTAMERSIREEARHLKSGGDAGAPRLDCLRNPPLLAARMQQQLKPHVFPAPLAERLSVCGCGAPISEDDTAVMVHAPDGFLDGRPYGTSSVYARESWGVFRRHEVPFEMAQLPLRVLQGPIREHSALQSDRRADQAIGISDQRANQIEK